MTTLLAPATLSPELIRVRDGAPGGVLRVLLLSLLALFAAALAWAALARLDIVATAGGKLVPAGHVKIVQPADAGVVDEIRVAEGQRVREGELLMRLNAVVADADARSIGGELARRRLELRRIDAELRGEPLRAQAGDEPAQLSTQAAQAQADLQALHDAEAEATAALDRAQAERAGAERQRDQLQRLGLGGQRVEDEEGQGGAGRLDGPPHEHQRLLLEAPALGGGGRVLVAGGHALAQQQQPDGQVRAAEERDERLHARLEQDQQHQGAEVAHADREPPRPEPLGGQAHEGEAIAEGQAQVGGEGLVGPEPRRHGELRDVEPQQQQRDRATNSDHGAYLVRAVPTSVRPRPGACKGPPYAPVKAARAGLVGCGATRACAALTSPGPTGRLGRGAARNG